MSENENIYDNPYEYEDVYIDLCECYEPIFEPPRSFENECKKFWEDYWNKKRKPYEFPDGSYIENSDGEIHYYRNGIMIKVTERFASDGRTVSDLIEDLVIYRSKQM